jgi:ATP-dependent DNA helicase RecG
MEKERLKDLVHQLVTLPHETEWVEFKHNHTTPQEIGEYISAISNSCTLHGKPGDISFGG